MFKQPTHSGLWFDFQFFFQFPFSIKCWEHSYCMWCKSHTLNLEGFLSLLFESTKDSCSQSCRRKRIFERSLRIYTNYTEEDLFENVTVFQINDLRFSWHCLRRLTFWDMKPCWVEIRYRNFGEYSCFHL